MTSDCAGEFADVEVAPLIGTGDAVIVAVEPRVRMGCTEKELDDGVKWGIVGVEVAGGAEVAPIIGAGHVDSHKKRSGTGGRGYRPKSVAGGRSLVGWRTFFAGQGTVRESWCVESDSVGVTSSETYSAAAIGDADRYSTLCLLACEVTG